MNSAYRFDACGLQRILHVTYELKFILFFFECLEIADFLRLVILKNRFFNLFYNDVEHVLILFKLMKSMYITFMVNCNSKYKCLQLLVKIQILTTLSILLYSIKLPMTMSL